MLEVYESIRTCTGSAWCRMSKRSVSNRESSIVEQDDFDLNVGFYFLVTDIAQL